MRHPGESESRSFGVSVRGHGPQLTMLLLLAPLGCLAAACGGTGAASAPPTRSAATPSPSPTAVVITPLEGTWATKFTATDVSSIGWHFDPGTWLIITHGERSTLFRPSGQVMDDTTIELAGSNEVVFPAEACPSEPQPTTGMYTFRITGEQLVFTEVRDSCSNRAFQLTAHPWTKQH